MVFTCAVFSDVLGSRKSSASASDVRINPSVAATARFSTMAGASLQQELSGWLTSGGCALDGPIFASHNLQLCNVRWARLRSTRGS